MSSKGCAPKGEKTVWEDTGEKDQEPFTVP